MKKRAEIFFETFMEQPPQYILDLENEALQHEVPIIRRATGDLLRYMIRSRRPKRILEIGTAIGYSSLFMASVAPNDTTITTIEKVPARIKEATKNLAKYDTKGMIHLRQGDATMVLKELVKEGQTFDFIFMDAAKGHYLNFLPDLMQMLETYGVLVSDNILHDGDVLQSRYAVTRRDRTIHGRMREYIYALTHHEELETLCLDLGDGMTISTKCEKPHGNEENHEEA